MNRTFKIGTLAAFSLAVFSFSAFAADAQKISVIDNGKIVTMNFTIKSEGVVLETTEGKDPFKFTYGQQQIIPGVDEALKGLKAGDKKQLTLTPEKAFGVVDPKGIVEFPKDQFKQKNLQAGMVFTGQSKTGIPLKGLVKEVKDSQVVLDFNHPLAGKTVEVDLEIIEVV